MKKIKLFGIIFSLLIAITIFGFFSGNDPGNKPAVTDYINNGGQIVKPSFQNYTPDFSSSWTAGTSMPSPTRYHGAGALWSNVGGDSLKLVCFAGDPDGNGDATTLVNVYNASTNAWTFGIPLPTGKFYNFACCLGDTAYNYGGMTANSFASVSATVDRFNVRTNTLSAGTLMPSARGDGRALPYQDSLIYILGGWDASQNGTANVYVYNIHTGTYRAATTMPQPRTSFAAAITGDTIVVVCGGTGYNTGLSNTVYRGYINQGDRSQIVWAPGANYPGTGRHRMYAAAWGCKGIIVGPSSQTGFTTNSECYVYSPGNDTWTVQPSVPVPTSAYFCGSSRMSYRGIWKFVIASGLVLTPPYSIPNVQIFTDSLCGITLLPLCEQFISTTFPPTGWNEVYSGTNYWSRAVVSANGLGSGSALYNMWDAPNGTNQTLITPLLNPSVAGDSLVLDEAFQPFGVPDSLIILTSTDGGSFYTSLARLGNSQLSTTTGNPSPFVPTATQWAKRRYGPLPAGTNRIQFLGKSGFGDNLYIDSICFTQLIVGIENNGNNIPGVYSLAQNYPNPFNPSTQIQFGLPKAGSVKLVVYDILGRDVKTLVNEFRNAGTYNITFDASQFASGIYFYKITSGDFIETKKMLLVK